MKIDDDLRATPSFIITWCMLLMGMLGVVFGISANLYDWPVDHNAGLALGVIMGAIGFGLCFAFLVKRREAFKLKGAYR